MNRKTVNDLTKHASNQHLDKHSAKLLLGESVIETLSTTKTNSSVLIRWSYTRYFSCCFTPQWIPHPTHTVDITINRALWTWVDIIMQHIEPDKLRSKQKPAYTCQTNIWGSPAQPQIQWPQWRAKKNFCCWFGATKLDSLAIVVSTGNGYYYTVRWSTWH